MEFAEQTTASKFHKATVTANKVRPRWLAAFVVHPTGSQLRLKMAEGPAASGAGPEGWVGQFAADVLGGHAGRTMQLVSAVAARPDTAARGQGSRLCGQLSRGFVLVKS